SGQRSSAGLALRRQGSMIARLRWTAAADRPMTKQEQWIEPTSTETFAVLRGRADAGLLLLCDHAGNAFPPEYGTLGLPESQLKRHIAYDIGAAEVTRRLSEALGAPAVMTRYSRLLIDPNRGEDDPTLI